MDDVDYYNRGHEMMHILATHSNRYNDDVEGFGVSFGLAEIITSTQIRRLCLVLQVGSPLTRALSPYSGCFHRANTSR